MNNLFASAWYWKKFYWKMFSTFLITGGTAITVGLAGTDWKTMTTTQQVIFIVGVIVIVAKAQDALVDQTFQNLVNGNSNGHSSNGNGNGAPSSGNQPTVQPH